MSLTVLLLNFPDEAASILESVLVGATDIKNLSLVPLSLVQKNGAARKSGGQRRYGHRLISSIRPQISRSDQIQTETEEWRRGAKAAAFQHFEAPFASDDIVLECFGSGAKVTKG